MNKFNILPLRTSREIEFGLVFGEVGGDEVDLPRIQGVSYGIVAVSDLIHGFPDTLIVLIVVELKYVDISRGEHLQVGATLIAVVLSEGRSAGEDRNEECDGAIGGFVMILIWKGFQHRGEPLHEVFRSRSSRI